MEKQLMALSTQVRHTKDWAWWGTPVIPALGKQWQGFEARMGYIARPCLQINKSELQKNGPGRALTSGPALSLAFVQNKK
jgi:hypothetical protein